MTDWFQKIRTEGSAVVADLANLTDIEITNGDGASLLHTAIAHSNMDAARELIFRGIDVNAMDSTGKTPLHYACDYHNPRAVELILDHGGLVDAVDLYGNTPLWSAVFGARGRYEVVALLIKHGASEVAEVKNSHDRSPLELARQIGDTHLTEILLAK